MPLLFSSGCSTLSNGQRPGVHSSKSNWGVIKSSAYNAVSDPETWVPALGAILLSVGDLDQDISDWASEKTPIFGSQTAAGNASDNFKMALSWSAIASAIAAPAGGERDRWFDSKLQKAGIEILAHSVSQHTKTFLKKESKRLRPDGSDRTSFPSGHTTQAYSLATLTSRNIDSLVLSEKKKRMLRLTAKSMAIGTAWARVEAKRHYPVDVLAGIALSHFITAFANNALSGLDENINFELSSEKDKIVFRFNLHF